MTSLREELANQWRKEREQKISVAAKTSKILVKSNYTSDYGDSRYTSRPGAFNTPRY